MKNENYARLIYILYFIGFVTGITAVIGLIIAYVKRNDEEIPSWLKTHFNFQIRTFWYGVIYLIVATLLSVIFIGILIYFWWFAWLAIRGVKDLLAIDKEWALVDNDGFLRLGYFGIEQHAR